MQLQQSRRFAKHLFALPPKPQNTSVTLSEASEPVEQQEPELMGHRKETGGIKNIDILGHAKNLEIAR